MSATDTALKERITSLLASRSEEAGLYLSPCAFKVEIGARDGLADGQVRIGYPQEMDIHNAYDAWSLTVGGFLIKLVENGMIAQRPEKNFHPFSGENITLTRLDQAFGKADARKRAA